MANSTFEELLFNAIKNGQVTVKSVYDIWLELGNTGTPQDFINSLKASPAVIVKGVSIPSSSWTVNTDGLYVATISNSDITANSVVNVNFTETTVASAIESGVLGYTSSETGAFKLFANFAPTVDLSIDYVIVNQ